MMDKLWAPWREIYLKRRIRGCFLCRYLKEKKDPRNFVVQRTRHSFSLLNLFPYNSGHMMIAPRRHLQDLIDLSGEERGDLLDLLIASKRLCQKVLRPDGFNIGINFGRAAGAGLENHLHLHLVPRWHGDTNFMPLLSGTKVISQSLEALYGRLTAFLKQNPKRSKK